MPALIVLRFIAGFFSAPPLANSGGSLNDIGNPIFRTLALPICTSMGFVGPILGPIIGSFVAESNWGWRGCYWVTAIWNGVSFGMVVLFMPETLGHALLKYKAIAWRAVDGKIETTSSGARLPGTGGNEKDGQGVSGPRKPVWRAEVEDESLMVALVRSLKRPFKMLVREPILVFFSIYLTGMSFASRSCSCSQHCSRPFARAVLTLVSGLYRPVRSFRFLPNSLFPTRPLAHSGRINIHTHPSRFCLPVWHNVLALYAIQAFMPGIERGQEGED